MMSGFENLRLGLCEIGSRLAGVCDSVNRTILDTASLFLIS
jgi:hypothetical protein